MSSIDCATCRISIIVSTYNRPDALAAVLQALTVQQSRNFEVIIADDGSGQGTAKLINDISRNSEYPVTHVWQEDDGFRAAEARNRAVAASTGDYLLFLDGDCIPRTDFFSRHRMLAETGWFVRGNRIMLSERFTQHVLSEKIALHDVKWSHCLWHKTTGNMQRIMPMLKLPDSPMRKLKKDKWHGVKTSNLGVWRTDFFSVNGFDEDYQGWGHEDADLAVRLIRSGVYRKEGIYSTAVFHLWHAMADRVSLKKNVSRLQQIIASDTVIPIRGLSRHLSDT